MELLANYKGCSYRNWMMTRQISCRSDSTSYVVTAGPNVSSDAKGVLIHGKFGKKQKQKKINKSKTEKKEQEKNKKTKKKGILKKSPKKRKKK